MYYYYISSSSRVRPLTCCEGTEGKWKYGSTLSLTSALEEGRWSEPRPGYFTHEKGTRCPLYMTLDGPQSRRGRVQEISLPPGF